MQWAMLWCIVCQAFRTSVWTYYTSQRSTTIYARIDNRRQWSVPRLQWISAVNGRSLALNHWPLPMPNNGQRHRTCNIGIRSPITNNGQWRSCNMVIRSPMANNGQWYSCITVIRSLELIIFFQRSLSNNNNRNLYNNKQDVKDVRLRSLPGGCPVPLNAIIIECIIFHTKYLWKYRSLLDLLEPVECRPYTLLYLGGSLN